MNEKHIARFIQKIKISKNGCWEWTGGLSNQGYGFFYISNQTKGRYKTVLAHRYSYEIFIGKIPNRRWIHHLCQNKCCVNPYHLEPQFPKEHLENHDTLIHNELKTHCPQGHPYSKENTWYDKNGYRFCKICNKIRKRHHK